MLGTQHCSVLTQGYPPHFTSELGVITFILSVKEGLATHSSILAWTIPWTEELGGLQSIGLQRIGHD